MEAICGAKCDECELKKSNKCIGCQETDGCPFGKKCWVAKYISIGGKEKFDLLKKEIITEINSLKIEGIPRVEELFPLNGTMVNLEYTLPSGEKVKILDDSDIYLGNQLECIFNDNVVKKCFGIVANMSFLLICEYEENGVNPEIVVYMRR